MDWHAPNVKINFNPLEFEELMNTFNGNLQLYENTK